MSGNSLDFIAKSAHLFPGHVQVQFYKLYYYYSGLLLFYYIYLFIFIIIARSTTIIPSHPTKVHWTWKKTRTEVCAGTDQWLIWFMIKSFFGSQTNKPALHYIGSFVLLQPWLLNTNLLFMSLLISSCLFSNDFLP